MNVVFRGPVGRTAAVTWLVDPARRESLLLIDGQSAVLMWPPITNNLAGLDIVGFTMSGRLRNIVLSEWKGGADAVTNAPPANADTLQLHDMTRCTGRLTSLHEGQFLLTDTAGAPAWPANRVAWVTFRKADQQVAPHHERDVRVSLVAGDQLTLNQARLDENGMTGTSEATGSITIPLAALQRIDFQPDATPPPSR